MNGQGRSCFDGCGGPALYMVKTLHSMCQCISACVVDPVEKMPKASILLSARYYTDIHKALNRMTYMPLSLPNDISQGNGDCVALAGKHVCVKTNGHDL